MKLIYGVKDRPKPGRIILFALQQLLAILAATIAVPAAINGTPDLVISPEMSPSAALFGAGAGTLIYLFFTKFKSPVFLGSSFAFLGSMAAAFSGATMTVSLGYFGLLLGAVFAGLIYLTIALIVHFVGVKWIEKIMPAIVIGPTVAIIGLSLAGNAVGQLIGDGNMLNTTNGLGLLCGIVTIGVTIVCSVYGKKLMKMIPFIIGILAG